MALVFILAVLRLWTQEVIGKIVFFASVRGYKWGFPCLNRSEIIMESFVVFSTKALIQQLAFPIYLGFLI